jgi:hypothetical protein
MMKIVHMDSPLARHYRTTLDISNVSVCLATPSAIEWGLRGGPVFSYSSLTAYATCPTYGAITHGQRRSSKTVGRSLATEAGTAAHLFFAADRVWRLITQDLEKHARVTGERLFGEALFEQMMEYAHSTDDPQLQHERFCVEALENSGYYDDPSDKRRTLANLEESCLHTLRSVDKNRFPVWVADPDDPNAPVGIELPVVLDVVVSLHESKEAQKFLVVCKIDGVHRDTDDDEKLVIEDNKTTGRIDEAWIEKWRIDHQGTLYALAMSCVLGKDGGEWVEHVHVLGSAVPLPRSGSFGGFYRVPGRRVPEDGALGLIQWIVDNAAQYYRYASDPLSAPRFSHSCNRFFRICEMLPICATPRDEQRAEMELIEQTGGEHSRELLNSFVKMFYPGEHANVDC